MCSVSFFPSLSPSLSLSLSLSLGIRVWELVHKSEQTKKQVIIIYFAKNESEILKLGVCGSTTSGGVFLYDLSVAGWRLQLPMTVHLHLKRAQ